MKINKNVKVVLGSLFGTLLLLFIVLVAHIATAKPVENATIQVSRIDFEKPIDAKTAADIKSKMLTIPGVKSDILVKGNVVVYFHDNKVCDAQKVYDQLMMKGDYNAKPFVVPVALASKSVCPVMNHDGAYYKFSKTVQKLFN
jgi:hypothetical protein